jgi:hypothetical protein
MKKLVLAILALIALFSALRSYAETAPTPSSSTEQGATAPRIGVQLHPGLAEIDNGGASIGIAFGLAETTGGQQSLWSFLPLRLVYTSGDKSVSLSLNGLSFLLRGGVSVGRPVTVSTPHAGDVISIGGKVTVDSAVQGDVWTLGADVELSPRADVSGNIVTLGGKIVSNGKAVVRGSVNQIPQLKIPLLGIMGTQFSVQVIAFGGQLLGFVLLGFLLFLSSFYRSSHARELYQALPSAWRPSLVTLALSLVLVPLVTAFLIASVIGIFFIPVMIFIVILAALDGFLLLCSRLGGWLRRSEPSGEGASLFLFTSGLLGLFLIKLPALVGIILTLLRSDAAAKAGQVLQMVTLGLTAAGMLYGFGAVLVNTRARASR